MVKKGIPQEWLKALACVLMLVDHIGAVLVPDMRLRAVGRIAFPIFCFLLVEGAANTRDPKKYGRRLLLGAVLSELPFDYLFYGGVNWEHQNVMLTLAIGLWMITWARKRRQFMLPVCICFFLAEAIGCDYGGWGIALIAVFMISAEKSHEKLLQFLGMAFVFWCMDSYRMPIGAWRVPIQFFGLLAMVPISLYSGRKATGSKALQWGFYLFYPAHLAALWLINML